MKLTRILACLLILALAVSLLPAVTPEANAAETDIQTIVEQQIRAYAKSIDQPDAVSAAASALAADVNGDGSVDTTDAYQIFLIYKENG